MAEEHQPIEINPQLVIIFLENTWHHHQETQSVLSAH